MVKAYKDNFLMSSNPIDECYSIHCTISSGDDETAELTRVAAEKEPVNPAGGSETAPPMEYDLEAELARALNTGPNDPPSLEHNAAEPTMEFAGLIEDEFDKAMSEQAALLEQEMVETPVEIEAVEEPAPYIPLKPETAAAPVAPVDLPVSSKEASLVPQEVQTEPVAEDNNSAFADQLAQLLSEQDTKVEEVAAPSIAEADLASPTMEADSTPTLSPKLPVFVPETSEPQIEIATPAEVVEVVEPPKDYSDPAAEFQSFSDNAAPNIPAPAPVMPEPFRPSFDAKPIESVLGASAALGAAALAKSDTPAEPDPSQLPPATTLESPEPDFAAELDAAFHEPPQAVEDDLVIPSADMYGPEVERGSGGRKVAFVVLAVALLGGVGAMASNFLGNSSDDAPVLMADGGAVKVKPKEAGGEVVPNQDQTVYKTVNGTAQKPAQETLADNTEQPIEMAKVTPAKRESRVSDAQASSESETRRLTPRSVRTSVVRPDGTIIASETDSGSSTVDLARLQPSTTVNKVKTVAISQDISGTANKTNVALEPKVEEPATGNTAKTVMPAGVVEIRAGDAKPAPQAVQPPKPVKVAKVETKAPKTVVKRVAPKKPKPVKKAKVAPKKSPPKAKEANLPTISSPYAVQISSRRSPEAAQAAWRQLSRKYASVLRGQSPDIRRVNIQGKGVYYRVRVPASSKAKAGSICSQLKKRGGSCFVTR